MEDLDFTNDSDFKPPKPFHKVLKDSPEERQAWLKNAFYFCREFYKPCAIEAQRNIAAYLGHYSTRSQTRQEYDEKTYKDPYAPPADDRLITNYAHEFTEEYVSRITTFKPSFAVLPSNPNEAEDVINAQTVKQLIDGILYDKKFDLIHQRVVRSAKITGECSLYPCWNPNAGPISKEQALIGEMMEGAEEASPEDYIAIEKGAPFEVQRPVRDGSLEFHTAGITKVYPEPRPFGMEGDWKIRIYTEATDTLKANYPQLEPQITPDKGGHWDTFMGKMSKLGEHTTVLEFWHADTDLVPGGYQILATTEVILSEGKNEYAHKEIPLITLKDIEADDWCRGISFFNNILPVQRRVNDLRYWINRNMRLFSHPKWLVEVGSINKNHLRNMPGILPVQPGAQKPELITFNSTPPEIYSYLESLVNEMRVLAGLHPISGGTAPKADVSGVALAQLKQEENERYNSFLAKNNSFLISAMNIAWKTYAQYARADHQLTVKLLGPESEYVFKKLDKAKLSTNYDVRLQNQSALGDTKAQQTANALEFLDRGIFTPDDVSETLALGSTSKAQRRSREPGRTQMLENDLLVLGQPQEVLETDDHAAHYRELYPMLQEQKFRSLPKEIRAVGEQHLSAHVMMMVEQVKTEMAFLPQPPSLIQFAQLPGWTLQASKYLSPEAMMPPAPGPGPGGQAPPPAGQAGAPPAPPPAAPPADMGEMPTEMPTQQSQ